MKKVLGIVLAVAMILSLVACGKKPAADEENGNGETTTQQTDNASSSDTPDTTDGVAVDTSDGKVTDPAKLGEAITYWVDGDYLYFKIKTSVEIDAHRYDIDIVNPGIYLTRDSEFITQSIYGNTRCFAEDFDIEYYDGYYVFWVDNNMITDLASDESEWAPGTWSVLLYNGDTRLVLGQWLIVLEGGGKYHFEFDDSFLFGAGEDRKVKEFDSLQDEVASWFAFKADESDDDWATFTFDGYYLEQVDPQGYDHYYLMVCPEGDYTTYEDADAVDLTYCGFGGLDYAKCPYRFAFEQYGLENGKYTMALARMGGNVEVQFTAEKKSPTDWKMDFSEVKCPALESKYADGVSSSDASNAGTSTETSDAASASATAGDSAVLASIGLTEDDIKSSLGFTLGTPTGTDSQYYVSVEYDSMDSFPQWVEAVAESCRKASKDGNIYESEFSAEAMTSFDIDDSAAINVVQFIYKTTNKVVYVTLSSSGSEENSFICNIQVY